MIKNLVPKLINIKGVIPAKFLNLFLLGGVSVLAISLAGSLMVLGKSHESNTGLTKENKFV